MIGIDLVEVARVESAITRRPRLAGRLFTQDELAYARSRRTPAAHLAARFAAKEAALKALGGPAVPIREIEVRGGGTRPPRLVLHGAAAREAERLGVQLDVSLTHTRELAAAAVHAAADRPS